MHCTTFTLSWSTEDTAPSAKDLNRFVIRKHSTDWHEIGIELGLEVEELNIIEEDCDRSVKRLRKTLETWLNVDDDATWNALEVALTNVNRTKLGLDPVDDVFGKDMN